MGGTLISILRSFGFMGNIILANQAKAFAAYTDSFALDQSWKEWYRIAVMECFAYGDAEQCERSSGVNLPVYRFACQVHS